MDKKIIPIALIALGIFIMTGGFGLLSIGYTPKSVGLTYGLTVEDVYIQDNVAHMRFHATAYSPDNVNTDEKMVFYLSDISNGFAIPKSDWYLNNRQTNTNIAVFHNSNAARFELNSEEAWVCGTTGCDLELTSPITMSAKHDFNLWYQWSDNSGYDARRLWSFNSAVVKPDAYVPSPIDVNPPENPNIGDQIGDFIDDVFTGGDTPAAPEDVLPVDPQEPQGNTALGALLTLAGVAMFVIKR